MRAGRCGLSASGGPLGDEERRRTAKAATPDGTANAPEEAMLNKYVIPHLKLGEKLGYGTMDTAKLKIARIDA